MPIYPNFFHTQQIYIQTKDFSAFLKYLIRIILDIIYHSDGFVVISYAKCCYPIKHLMIYNQNHPHLKPFKPQLINRKIKKFNESNWYEWGRKYYESEQKRIYVNHKTRQKRPFFIHEAKAYDGSVLAIFPKYELNDTQLQHLCDDLNAVNWEELGFCRRWKIYL